LAPERYHPHGVGTVSEDMFDGTDSTPAELALL
jgi:hypothetical protein